MPSRSDERVLELRLSENRLAVFLEVLLCLQYAYHLSVVDGRPLLRVPEIQEETAFDEVVIVRQNSKDRLSFCLILDSTSKIECPLSSVT